MIENIEEIARMILRGNPGVVVRHLLLRDVLQYDPGSLELKQARADLESSLCLQELEQEQHADGGWGAFHSRSTLSRQKVASTEVAVERGRALGLDASHPLLKRAGAYILDILDGRTAFPDYHEKNDRWSTGMRLILASTLTLITPDHPHIQADRELWSEIARRTFQSGSYDEEAEIQTHRDLTGATVKDSYLVLSSRYQLNLLGAVPGTLPPDLERALLDWLWHKPGGIGYLAVPLYQPPPSKPGPFDRWLASLELLARLFPAWIAFAGPSIEWLWSHREAHGLWDFGPRPASRAYFPLSDDWRHKSARIQDWSTRVLILLRKYESSDCSR